MSKIAQQSDMNMEASESENVSIDIRGKPPSNNDGVVNEWVACMLGKPDNQHFNRKRQIVKLPPLLLKGKKGPKKREYYEPVLVSLGPYYHNRPDLALAENYKLITLQEYCSNIGKTVDFLYNKVFEVIHDARACYLDDCTQIYNDEVFNRMMLRDSCFILFFIECISDKNPRLYLNNEYIGPLGFANITRDIFLLENQIPYLVLQVLLDLRFPDKGEYILNRFFNYLNTGEVKTGKLKVLENKQPLHLLELYRSYFIATSSVHSWWGDWTKNIDPEDEFNYVKRNRSFASVMELKEKGIFFKCSNEDIKFISCCCYGTLELVHRAISPYTQVLYMNMIAYELCPHNPNDLRIATFIRVMKSLIIHPDDVKELRDNNIMIHSLGRDEEVVKMYAEIEAPAVNFYMFYQLRRSIENHCCNKYKTWVAELINLYFSSPWKTVALVVATAILFTSFLQTYFSIRPLPDDGNTDLMKLLKRCAHFKPPST